MRSNITYDKSCQSHHHQYHHNHHQLPQQLKRKVSDDYDDDTSNHRLKHKYRPSLSILLRRYLLKSFIFHRRQQKDPTIIVTIFAFFLFCYLFSQQSQRRIHPRQIKVLYHNKQIHNPHHHHFIKRVIKLEKDEDEDHDATTLFHKGKRKISTWTKHDEEFHKSLNDEEYWDADWIRPFTGYEKQKDTCQPMHEWQLHHHPTCNTAHEQSLVIPRSKYLASGWYRSTFRVKDMQNDENIAFKTAKIQAKYNSFIPNLMDRHRVDSVIYDRTTKSPWITDIYGYCAFSGLYEYADGGTLKDHFYYSDKSRSRAEKLQYAIEISSGLADLHTIDSKDGYAAMSHTDIMMDQWVRRCKASRITYSIIIYIHNYIPCITNDSKFGILI